MEFAVGVNGSFKYMRREGIKRSNYEDLKRIVSQENFLDVVEALGRVALESSLSKEVPPGDKEVLENINIYLMESALKISKQELE